ncbi:ribonuclease D [Brevifollis gellanilyticus]|uniref:Ribonuclease D n=1 Tax=Brevifollis gellanilyticus TaxID=748831 RepID=A0A512M9A9_9BACT|nr:ribonuclease D [Brevifollis gellanilyticus]GEP43312.1 ribonuclease D [Brevifollis gellanilyticus]
MSEVISSPTPSVEVTPVADFEFISTPEHLETWVKDSEAHLQATGETRVCLDTEADSLHHYHEKLCLLQVACGGRFALVDPLAIADVSPLLALLDRYELWFHGADYDLTMLRRTYNWEPRMIRDTQIAARLAGARQFGLAALLQNVLGLTICKAPQKADWSRRPLPVHMLSYAVDDVRYLLQVADHFLAILRSKNRVSWFEQSCGALQKEVAQRSMAPREDPWRVQGSGRLNAKGLAILKAMWEWREGIAQERDIPCYRIMSNKQMVSYAEAFELGGVMNPPGGWRPRWKKEFHDLVAAVFRAGQASWPQRLKRVKSRMTDSQRDAVDKLCTKRDEIALGLDVEGSLLGSRSDLEQLIVDPATENPLMEWQEALLRPVMSEVSVAGRNGTEPAD